MITLCGVLLLLLLLCCSLAPLEVTVVARADRAAVATVCADRQFGLLVTADPAAATWPEEAGKRPTSSMFFARAGVGPGVLRYVHRCGTGSRAMLRPGAFPIPGHTWRGSLLEA